MATAEAVAERLAYEFLRDGKYEASSGPVEVKGLLSAAAAAASHKLEAEAEEFGNISVQSVGFEEGTSEPKVHIYLNRSSRKLIDNLAEGGRRHSD